MILIWSKYW